MTNTRDELMAKLWRGVDPYEGLLWRGFTDHQGWNSNHPWLTQTIEESDPRVIVEVGVWKGTSVITMAERLRELGIDGVVIAIDTWLGGYEFWINTFFDDLRFVRGYPTIYHTFMSNIIEKDLEDYVIPLPMDSASASRLLRYHGIRPGMIHIDGCHEFESVALDLTNYWPLLAPGGVLIGDDYHAGGGPWIGVRDAFDQHFAGGRAVEFEAMDGKCRATKGRTEV